MTSAERTLTSIIRQAERIRPRDENEDEQMYYLIGAIIANAEDALGTLKARAERETAIRQAEREVANLKAIMSGGFRFVR